MYKSILIIDDEEQQAKNLKEALSKSLPDCKFEIASSEEEIESKINHYFFLIAIVDLRMDGRQTDGIGIIQEINERNPIAKVIAVSAYSDEYAEALKKLIDGRNIFRFSSKSSFSTWLPELEEIIKDCFLQFEDNHYIGQRALLSYYNDAKNETDTFKKGQSFEYFISTLFSNMGYSRIRMRVKDRSSNEVDLIVRNETTDLFLNKFGKYFLVECKNKPNEAVGKNDFIVFYNKLRNASSMSELGILCTSGYIARTTYLEAMRESQGEKKVIFLSNPEIVRMITSDNIREEFKNILDEQVKDN